MALIPEFISTIKDIRDRMYPVIQTVYTEMLGLTNARVTTPTINVPNNEDGSAGDGLVIYDKATGEFTFSLPIGAKGKDLGITYAVTTIIERDALTGMIVGEIAFVDDTSMIYTYLESSVWGTGVLFTPTTNWTGLSDTPTDYIGKQLQFVQCRSDELGVQFISKDNALSAELTRINNNENAIAVLDSTKIGATDYATDSIGGTVKVSQNFKIPNGLLGLADYTAGDIPLVYSNDLPTSTGISYDFAKVAEAIIFRDGTITCKYSLQGITGVSSTVGKVYINGIAVGVQTQSSNSAIANFSYDFAVNKGDRVQIYIAPSTDNEIATCTQYSINTGTNFDGCQNIKIG